MKIANTLFLVLFLVAQIAFATNAWAASNEWTCHTPVGTIKTSGNNKDAARSQASRLCFDRQLAQFNALRGHDPEGEQADLMIESCVNIRCK